MVKQEGKPNDLMERIQKQAYFAPVLPNLQALTDPTTFIGRCPQIVEKLVSTKVKTALEPYAAELSKAVDAELKV